MNTVVSNTSPLRYLMCIGEQELLKHLFSNIFIPQAVFQELTHQQTPEIVRNVMQDPPAWIHIRDVKRMPDVSLQHLDAGESAAILLAEQMQADLLLMDEKKGRFTAAERGIKVVGTLGILELAVQQGRIDLPQIVSKLLQTNFKVSPSLIQALLKRHA